MRPTSCIDCNGPLDPLLPDCPACGAHLPRSDEHHDSDVTFEDTDPALGHRTVKRKWRFHFPWGLLVLLGLYAGGTTAFLRYRRVNSPAYQAREKVQSAMQIMGKDNGQTATPPQLEEAYADLIQAADLRPNERPIFEELEEVEKVMLRRGHKPDSDLKRKAGILAGQYAEIQAGRQGMLIQGARDRWDLDAIADGSIDLTRYLVIGGLVIVLLWAYREFQDHVHAQKQDDENLLNRREELHSLNAHRKR